jgi:hypothetical protein
VTNVIANECCGDSLIKWWSEVVLLDRYSIRVFGWVRKMLQICWGVIKDKEALECCYIVGLHM